MNRGIWNEVGRMIGKDARWCSKYYSNTFKKHLYLESLNLQDKQMIQEKIEHMITMKIEKGDIVAACKEMMKHRNVFLNRVESFAHQYYEICSRRLKPNPY